MKNKTPPDSGSCCLPGAQGVTYLKIGPRQASVGMLNLGIAFQQLYQSGRQLPEISNQDLLESVREFNYVPAVQILRTLTPRRSARRMRYIAASRRNNMAG